ncbi:tyrosine-type recombinase/integrase [Nannocystis pusilla]|uniref:tyrosine-type recombinase/integrase n=1 Tax=Nannocystis pusilla TaxID=889268 RepID=UPI003BF2F392
MHERKDGTRAPRLQVVIYALAPGKLKVERYRYSAPRSITSKSAALRWGEQVRREIEAGRPPPPRREDGAKPAERKPADGAADAAEQKRPKTIREVLEIYLADCAGRGNTASTVDAKRTKLAHVLAVVGDVEVAEAGELEASRVRSDMKAKGYGTTTINTTIGMFATMLARCRVLRLRPTQPEKLEKVKERKIATPKAYDDPTFEALLVAATKLSSAHRATVLVCGEAALRVGELIGLEVRDVNLEARTLRVERALNDDGEITPPKNGEARTVGLTERLVDALRPFVEGRPPTAPLLEGRFGGRLTRGGVRDRLARAQAAVGLPQKGPHVLRHTCATSALKGGADVVAVQKMLGHRQLATTVEAYLHDTGDSMERATQALAKARCGITAFGTNLTQAPKTRRSGVVRQSRQNPVKAL